MMNFKIKKKIWKASKIMTLIESWACNISAKHIGQQRKITSLTMRAFVHHFIKEFEQIFSNSSAAAL